MAPDPSVAKGAEQQAIRAWLPDGFSRRMLGIAAALAIELLILIMLLSLNAHTAQPPPPEIVTSFDAREEASPAPDEAEAAPEDAQSPDPAAQAPAPQEQLRPVAAPALPLQQPSPLQRPIAPPVAPPAETPPQPAAPARSTIGAVIREGTNYGPANSPRSGPPDSQVVGTAPDGSPLYAARWYREPNDGELAGYLSTASGPGWGMITCKTAPNWRVEDCVILGESPQGSNIARAANAAAWQFQVRPPRVGGQYQIGAWVRIRIDYSTRRGPGG